MKSNGKKRRLHKSVISVIVTVAVLSAILLALIITNVFVPVKYLTAYCVKKHKNEEGTLRVSFLNASFGDCTVIELPDGKTVLIDGGDGAYSNTYNILKSLNSRGVDKIDYLICSSVKPEHCGGLAEIVKYKGVGYAYIPYCQNTRITSEYYSFISALNKKGVNRGYACVGEGVEGEDYFLTFLSPTNYASPEGEYAALNLKPTNENKENASAVVWLEYGGTAFAFTSDVRSDGLKRIVEEYQAATRLNQPYCKFGENSVKLENCKISTAPAHAGKLNTYAPWYDLTEPEQVIISTGKNLSGYPSNEALADILNSCAPRYTYGGNITVTVKDDVYEITN